MRTRSLAGRSLVLALVLSGAACAHAPLAVERPGAAAPQDRVLVTGSRIPRPLDASGRPATFSPVTIHTREALVGTGMPGDLEAALRRIDPSFP